MGNSPQQRSPLNGREFVWAGMLSMVLVLTLIIAGCPQDAANLGGTDSTRPAPGQDAANLGGTDSTRPAPGQDAPTQGGELLEGPGFSLALPSGLVLKEQDSPHPGRTFWRYYEDTLGLRAIAVLVDKPSGAGASSLEEVSVRVKGAAQSATGDFLLVARSAASSFFGFEAEAAIGLLADGNVLVVQIGSYNLNGADELIATGVFTSIDLKDTDGRALEQRWRETSTTLIAKTTDGLVVLSDLSVWSLYSDKTSAEVAEVASWNLSDPVFPQILSTHRGVERGDLVHVGHWWPVKVFKVGAAVDATIAAIEGGLVRLSDETAWIVGTQALSGWNVGDRILRVQNGSVLSLIHARTGQVVTNPGRAVIGPGFQLNLPQPSVEEVTLAPAPGVVYWKAFYDPTDDLFYGVAVAPADAVGGSVPIEQLTIRIRGSVTTTSGDFLLLGRFAAGGFQGLEADFSIGLLADGRALQQEIGKDAKPVLVRASNGMLVLDDLSIWTLTYWPKPADAQEFNRWRAGDKVIWQSYRKQYASKETYELVHVGNWIPVEVESDATATDTSIAAIVGVDRIRLSDGSLWSLTGSVPAAWDVGDRVLRVREKFSYLSEWLILVETGAAIKAFRVF